MTDSNSPSAVLFLTVGMGSAGRLEETLYTPMSKSISSGNWRRIVLLPSQGSLEHACELRRRHAECDVAVRELPRGVSENDADACYTHFEQVIADELVRGSSPEDMAVDITRGTKAMSAALLLAAFRHRIARVRYVEGDRDRNNPGVVEPGTERVREIHAAVAFHHRTIDDAHLLMRQGNFAAASFLLQPLSDDLETKGLVRIADFYSAWDRFDYKSAAELDIPSEVPEPWQRCVPPEEVRRWVRELARPWPQHGAQGYSSLMAERLRLLVVDLLANGWRRVRHRQFEDAVLRAYRVLEMLGQARLFERGFDSARLPRDSKSIKEFQEDLKKEGSAGFGVNRDGTLNAGRELFARLLQRLGDPLAPKLLRVAAENAFRVTTRNRSILIHGFEAVGPDDESLLDALYEELCGILREDSADFGARLKIARFPDQFALLGFGAL